MWYKRYFNEFLGFYNLFSKKRFFRAHREAAQVVESSRVALSWQ
jgi:hypothetical protein